MEDEEANKFNHLAPSDNHSLWTQSCCLQKNAAALGGDTPSSFQAGAQQSGIFPVLRSSHFNLAKEGDSLGLLHDEHCMKIEDLGETLVALGGQVHAPSLPKLASVTVIYEAPGKNKRGRKPLRPQDPIRRKTEEKDKYWLRAFRAYMQKRFNEEKKSMSLEDRFFWREYLSPEGKPDKGNPYLSYGQKYKDYLFSHQTFTSHFAEWFREHGEEALSKKYQKSSDLWFVYFDYALKELLSYSSKS